MWVRVARSEGGTPEGLDAEMAQSKQHLADAKTGGLPAGLEGVTRVLEAINRTEGTGCQCFFAGQRRICAKPIRRSTACLALLKPLGPAIGDQARRSEIQIGSRSQ
jgi:hypothetical protein